MKAWVYYSPSAALQRDVEPLGDGSSYWWVYTPDGSRTQAPSYGVHLTVDELRGHLQRDIQRLQQELEQLS